jgi:alpha-tubulin suppressor-like RCC1 family protein
MKSQTTNTLMTALCSRCRVFLGCLLLMIASAATAVQAQVVAWGDNYNGQRTVPAGLSGVVAISAGGSHSLALKANGSVVAWGFNSYGQRTVPAGLSGVVAIACGSHHSLALKADGSVAAWGYNSYGQSTVPVGLSGVVAISAGYGHSLALKADGSVGAWGSNFSGVSTVPAGLSGVAAISAGGSHSLALKADGSVIAWGSNDSGVSTVPAGLSGVVAISAGGSHSLALKEPAGLPVITSARRWTTEAAGARPGNVLFYQRIFASGSPTGYGAAGLPPGLALDPATGVISGAATAVGTFPVTLSATNASGTSTTEVVLTVTGLPRLLLPLPTVLQNGNTQIFAIGYIALTGLPAGTTFDSTTGILTGLRQGIFTLSVTIFNPFGNVTLPWTVEVPAIIAWGANNYGQTTVPSGLSGVVATSAGLSHSLALKADGSVVAWGSNGYGQSTVPAGLSGVVAISAGGNISLALKEDGFVVAWGSNSNGQSTVPAGLNGVVAISAGYGHSLALKEDGSVVAWGSNGYGQSTVPAGLSGVVAISAGGVHSLALKADGFVVAWGNNSYGQNTLPAGQSGVVAISAGDSHSLALKADGSVVAWGSNGRSTLPEGLSGVVAISGGDRFSLALKADGSVVGWGDNYYQSTLPAGLSGVVAISCGGSHSLALKEPGGLPVITSSKRWISEAAGARPGEALFYQRIFASGSPTGYAASGLPPGLGLDPSTGVISGAVTAVGTFPITLSATNARGTSTADVILIVTGLPRLLQPLPELFQNGTAQIFAVGTIAITGLPAGAMFDSSTGILTGLPLGNFTLSATVSNAFGNVTIPLAAEVPAIFTWGYQSGQNTVPSGLIGGIVAVSAGESHSLALKADGSVVAWGGTYAGQSTVPEGLSGVVAISTGGEHSLALKADGSMIAWGANYSDQISVPAGLSGVVAISAGFGHSMALKEDGSVVAWGDTYSGQSSVPEGLSGVVAISAGNSHSLALKADGSVVAWGGNYAGQSTVPAGLRGVVAISAGSSHSLALKADGSVVAWGSNSYDQITVPAGLSGVMAISAGYAHSLALKEDGSVAAWGAYGQSAVPAGLSGVVAISAGNSRSLALKEPTGLPVITSSKRWITEAAAARPGDVLFYQRIFASGTPTGYAVDGLPPGLVLNPTTGVISGAATAVGTFPITLSATNASGTSTAEVVLTVTGLPRLAQPLPAVLQNRQIFTVGAISLIGLPAGAMVNSATGILTGLPPGIFMLSVTISNPYGSVTIPWEVEVPPIAAWGLNDSGQSTVPTGLSGVIAISAGSYSSLVLKPDGSVVAWGAAYPVPAGLSGVVAIASGGFHSLALKADGSVVAWGSNYYGQSTVPAGLNGVVAISAGYGHSLALKADGSVIAWGHNTSGQTTVPAGLSGVVTISAGSEYSLALKADGSVVAWGDDSHGQSTVPVGLSGVVAISAGSFHSLALKADGSVVAWGHNTSGQSTVPAGLSGVVAISAGEAHSLALKADGSMIAWGNNSSNQGTVPVGLYGVMAISAGYGHSLALIEPAGLPVITSSKRWITEAAGARAGNVLFRQQIFASGSPTGYAASGLPPGLVLDPATGVISGAATAVGTYLITLSATNASGTSTAEVVLTVTGLPRLLLPLPTVLLNGNGQITALGAIALTSLPAGATVESTTGILTGFPAGNFTLNVTISNPFGNVTIPWTVEVPAIAAWGANYSGQSTVPEGLSGVVAISAGDSHSLALKADGSVVAWGNNSDGQSTVPAGLSGVVAISAGGAHSLALKADGSVVAWGDNTSGQSTMPPGLNGVVAITCGRYYSLALKEDGSVVAWGYSGYGQSTMPAGLNGVVAISAGESHSLALKADGSVVAWGASAYGQGTVPGGLSGVMAISAGSLHSLALKQDGTVVAWGNNYYGQTTVPAELSGMVAISAGYRHSLALRADGSVVAWGGNYSGQWPVVEGLGVVVAISAGSEHSLALLKTAFDASAGSTAVNASISSSFSRPGPTPSLAIPQFAATNLPPGLTINATTGAITGTFIQAGFWQTEVRIFNRVGSLMQPLTFSIEPAPSANYATWTQAFWPTAGAASAPTADPDGDGVSNLLEYALHTSPMLTSPTVPPALARANSGALVLEMEVPTDRANLLQWRAQFSDDLNFATPDEVAPTEISGAAAGMTKLRFTDPTVTTSPRRMGRLRVTTL